MDASVVKLSIGDNDWYLLRVDMALRLRILSVARCVCSYPSSGGCS